MTNDTVSIVDSGVIESWCNRKGKKFLSYILIFDHNNAFDTALINDSDAAYIVKLNVTMRQAARHAVHKINVRYNRPFKREDIMTQRQYDSFMNRLKELNIKQKD